MGPSALLSEVWTRVLWILRVPPDKRAFSRAGMLVCQPWLWPDTFRHYQFRGITSIKGITSISSSTGITSSHGCGFARHTSPNKTDSYFFRAFSGFCGPSPVLRAFSGFAGLLRVCVLPQPLRARSFLFLFFKKKKVEKALSTWEKPMAKNEVPHSKNTHRPFPGVSCLLLFFFFFSGRFPPAGSASP